MHVVRLVRRVRDQGVEITIDVVRFKIILDVEDRRVLEVVLWQESDQRLHVLDRVLLVGAEVVRVAGLGVVGPPAAQFLHGDVLAGDGLDHVRTGDEHLRRLVDHHDEVGQCRGVDVSTGGRTHDQGDLRDDPAGVGVPAEDLAVEPEGDHALLNPGAATLVESDQRAAGLQREVDDLDDLLAVDLSEAAAEDRHVLAEHADRPVVDGPEAGDHTVSVGSPLLHPERRGAVPGELVELGERPRIQQQLDPLAGGLLALGMLLLHCGRRARVHRLVDPQVEISELASRGVDVGRRDVAIHNADSSDFRRLRVVPVGRASPRSRQ